MERVSLSPSPRKAIGTMSSDGDHQCFLVALLHTLGRYGNGAPIVHSLIVAERVSVPSVNLNRESG